ncbi:MAG: hypothetical protein NTZ69_18165 [Bacteroidia bacterium]|nr:hypothetical protein [Bacteroidia bacterium]
MAGIYSESQSLKCTCTYISFTNMAGILLGPYSQAILVGQTAHLSEKIAIDPETGKTDTLIIETEIKLNIGRFYKLIF